MSQLLVSSKTTLAPRFQERRVMRERDQQKWSPVLRPGALLFFEEDA